VEAGSVRHEFAVTIEQDKGWFIAHCLEIPGANGQGRTKQRALESVAAAIELIFEDRGWQVEVSIENGALLVRPLRRRYTLDELLSRVTKSNIHGDVSAGAPMGREAL
jgi:antitoxin component of MazEF toxin-antitoxin module